MKLTKRQFHRTLQAVAMLQNMDERVAKNRLKHGESPASPGFSDDDYGNLVAALQADQREPAVLKHGKLICSCGNKSMPPNLEEGGYSVTHELKKITPSTIEATGWAGSSSECCESGEDYFLSCRQCGKEYDLLPGQTIEWQ